MLDIRTPQLLPTKGWSISRSWPHGSHTRGCPEVVLPPQFTPKQQEPLSPCSPGWSWSVMISSSCWAFVWLEVKPGGTASVGKRDYLASALLHGDRRVYVTSCPGRTKTDHQSLSCHKSLQALQSFKDMDSKEGTALPFHPSKDPWLVLKYLLTKKVKESEAQKLETFRAQTIRLRN